MTFVARLNCLKYRTTTRTNILIVVFHPAQPEPRGHDERHTDHHQYEHQEMIDGKVYEQEIEVAMPHTSPPYRVVILFPATQTFPNNFRRSRKEPDCEKFEERATLCASHSPPHERASLFRISPIICVKYVLHCLVIMFRALNFRCV